MCMKSTRHCLLLTRVWSEHKDKEMSLSMRPLHKRKSLYYGCKVRNRAAICACNEPKFELARNLGEYRDSEPARARFWEDKHMRKNLTEVVFILDRSGSMSGPEWSFPNKQGFRVTKALLAQDLHLMRSRHFLFTLKACCAIMSITEGMLKI